MPPNSTAFWMLNTKEPELRTNSVSVEIGEETLLLYPEKVAFWPKENILFVADCHFGKVAHFRKSGIGLPARAGTETFGWLHQILLEIKPARLIFLGDIFHSEFNQDFDIFRNWRQTFPAVQFDLVLGNHDKAGFSHLHLLGIHIHPELVIGPFHCTHEPQPDSEKGFNLCGHIHPGVSLSIGRQHVKVPCFWLGPTHLCFPSFGNFTGSVAIRPGPQDRFFAISGSKIRELEGSVL